MTDSVTLLDGPYKGLAYDIPRWCIWWMVYGSPHVCYTVALDRKTATVTDFKKDGEKALRDLKEMRLLLHEPSFILKPARNRLSWVRKRCKLKLLVKEIRSRQGVLHFKRWRLFDFLNVRLYLHGIYQADKDSHLHDHPWNFVSFLFWGAYDEQTMEGVNERRALSLAYRKAHVPHKILRLHGSKALTLVLAWGKTREWGFKTESGRIQHEAYRKMKHAGTLPPQKPS